MLCVCNSCAPSSTKGLISCPSTQEARVVPARNSVSFPGSWLYSVSKLEQHIYFGHTHTHTHTHMHTNTCTHTHTHTHTHTNTCSHTHTHTQTHMHTHTQDSPIIDLYPTNFKIDLNGKKYAWQGVALLPFVEEDRLLQALSQVYPDLTKEEGKLPPPVQHRTLAWLPLISLSLAIQKACVLMLFHPVSDTERVGPTEIFHLSMCINWAFKSLEVQDITSKQGKRACSYVSL